MSIDPPALGFPEPPNVSLRLISVRFPFFWAQMDAVVLAVYVSLSISWLLRCSGCDLWPTFRPTCAQLWEVLHVCRLNRLLARWLGGGGVGGVRILGGGGGVITSCRRPSWRSSWSCNIQHPTRAWCYAVALLLATSNTLLMLRCGTSSCNMLVGGLGRMGLLSTTARDKIEHRNLLCAHYLNKEPGLERVLRALAIHRQKASNGLTSPSQCFQKPLWNLWPQWKAQKKVTISFWAAVANTDCIGICNEF